MLRHINPSFQVDQISGKIAGQFLIPHARSDLTQLHSKVDAGPDLMNPTSRFEYDGPEGNGSWREIQPLSLTGENVIFFFNYFILEHPNFRILNTQYLQGNFCFDFFNDSENTF